MFLSVLKYLVLHCFLGNAVCFFCMVWPWWKNSKRRCWLCCFDLCILRKNMKTLHKPFGVAKLKCKKKWFSWKVIQVFWIVKLGRISCLNVSKSCSLYRVYKSLRHLNLFSASPSSAARFYHTFIPKCGDRTEEELTLNLQNWWVDVQCVPVQQTNTMFCCVCWSLIWL